MKWSITSSDQFSRCQRIIYYKKNNYKNKTNHNYTNSLSKYTIVGNIVHDTFEQIYTSEIGNIISNTTVRRDKIKLIMRDLLEKYDWINNEDDVQKDWVFEKSFRNIKQGKAVLEKKWKKCEIISVEEKFIWEINNIPIEGKIDLILRDEKDNYWIIDWKTQFELNSSIDDPQLSIYREWAKNKFGSEHIELAHIYTSHGKYQQNYTKQKSIEKLVKRIFSDYDYWSKFSKEEDYNTSPHIQNCTICKYIYQCPDRKIES